MLEPTAMQPTDPTPATTRWTPWGLPVRWLATGGAAVLAGAVGVALAVQSGSPACAAPPTGNAVHNGKATFYDLQSTGNCSTAAPADRLFVALGPAEYSAAGACGGYLDVTGPKGKVRVKITDQCPECAPGHLDLSREAFTRIADPVQGIVPITYRAAVNAPVPGPLTFRIKEGASQFWFAVLVDNHANPLRSVEVRSGGGGFRAANRASFNYWIIDSGAGSGPYTIKLTDVYGRQATADGIKLSPGTTQRSSVTMSGAAVAAPATKATKSAAKPAGSKPAAKPAGSDRSPAVAPTSPRVAAPPVDAGSGAVAGSVGSPTPVTSDAAGPLTAGAPADAGSAPLALAADRESCG